MVNAISHIQASWLSDYNGGIYDDSRQEKKACFGRINKIIFRCCEQATDSTCKYNLNHEVSSQPFPASLIQSSRSKFSAKKSFPGDDCWLRQRRGNGLLACQKLLGNMVRILDRKRRKKQKTDLMSIARFGEDGYFKIKRGTGHCGVSIWWWWSMVVW